MKKLWYLLFLLLFITGCDAEYNLNINKATVIETLKIYEDDINKWDDEVSLFSTSYEEAIENNLNYKLGIFYDEQLEDAILDNPNYTFYKPEKIETKNRLGITYNYRFNTDNYERAYFPKNCFDNIKVYEDSGNFTISTSKGFNCIKEEFGLSNLTINITTKYEVEMSNSDKVDGRTYSWLINQTNYDDKNVYIRVNTNKLSTVEVSEDEEKKMIKTVLTIGLTLAILLIIVIIFLVSKKRKLEND